MPSTLHAPKVFLLKIFFLSVITISLLAFFIFKISGFRQDLDRAKLSSLNYSLPFFFEYLIKLQENSRVYFDERKLRVFTRYFQRVVSYMPSLPEAQAMAGFCAYYEGNRKRAIEFYSKAVSLDPTYFWYAYDLGVILFEDGQIEKGEVTLQKALKLKPGRILEVLSTSKIYHQILSAIPQLNYDFKDSYVQAHQDIAQRLILSQRGLNTPQKFKVKMF